MNLLFATGHAALPQEVGGIQVGLHELCSNLKRRGHKVAILAKLRKHGYFGLKQRVHAKVNSIIDGNYLARDDTMGYPVWRTWFPDRLLGQIIEEQQPDVVGIFSADAVPIARAAQCAGKPFLMYFQDLWYEGLGGDLSEFLGSTCVANSRFTANAYFSKFGTLCHVIHPLIDPSRYRVESERKYAIFVNPVPPKGLHVAKALAKELPAIPFKFVEAWTLKPKDRRQLLDSLAAIENVQLCGPYKDMREIYRNARIVVVPSQYDEAYGRVAFEPQLSGVPVIASNWGGLPEAVGPGGVLVDRHAPAEVWASVLGELWNNQGKYDACVSAARLHAEAEYNQMEFKLRRWECLFGRAADSTH